MTKIVLTKGCALPPVVSPTGYLFENARGGPYRFGVPLLFNAEAANRIKQGDI